MEVLSRISRLARHLDRSRANAFSAHDLESWEFDVLAALRRSGPPYRLSPGQLLRETLVTSGTMTNRVDRLAARGLVARQDHPEDRRGVLVQLTQAGKDAVDAAMAELLTAERGILAVLDVAEQDQLTYWDVAGALTLFGICVASQVEPDQMVRLIEGTHREP